MTTGTEAPLPAAYDAGWEYALMSALVTLAVMVVLLVRRHLR